MTTILPPGSSGPGASEPGRSPSGPGTSGPDTSGPDTSRGGPSALRAGVLGIGPTGLARRLSGRLTPADLRVLRLYLFTRLGLWLVAYSSAWLFPPGALGAAGARSKSPASWLSRWERWDWVHYQRIAEYGYFDSIPGGDPARGNRPAFFPGFPLVLRAVHTVVTDWTVAGLLISLVSGAVAVVALARIAGLGRPDGALAGQRAAVILLFSPAAVFLAAGYTESLFLAFALPAWLAAKNRHWRAAGILAAAGTTVRISGLFLAAAIVVEFLLAQRERSADGDRIAHRTGRLRRLRPLSWCALPVVPVAAFTGYLWLKTGDWSAWQHAQERGWRREFHSPLETLEHTWQGAFGRIVNTGYAVEFQLELVAMAVGALLLAVLLIRRCWPEALYIALNLWALGTSYWYLSVPRATLLWWPLWIGLAHWSLRRGWVKDAYLGVVAPLSIVLAVTFTAGRWSG